MCAIARSRAGPICALSVGNNSQGISMVLSMSGVIGPIKACWGSSAIPGCARQVTINNCGSRKVQVSEVSGLTALPNPEFCIMAMPRPYGALASPASATPAMSATASPSFAIDK
jgi:hypothetical protein